MTASRELCFIYNKREGYKYLIEKAELFLILGVCFVDFTRRSLSFSYPFLLQDQPRQVLEDLGDVGLRFCARFDKQAVLPLEGLKEVRVLYATIL